MQIKKFMFLHVTIFILAASFAASKAASMYMSRYGFFSFPCVGSLILYAALTGIYAIAWQYNLERFELSFLYTNRTFYMLWSQIFAVQIFGEEIYWNNVLGLTLIFFGVWVNSKDA